MKASAPSPALASASARAWTSETTCTRMASTLEQVSQHEEHECDEQAYAEDAADHQPEPCALLELGEVTDAGQHERHLGLGLRQEAGAARGAGHLLDRHVVAAAGTR